MAGHTVLLNMLGGICLLLWATRMVKTGVMRAFGEKFRQSIGHATRRPLIACLTGMGVAAAVQSSSATALIVISFIERSLIPLSTGLAVMLGADIGSTLVVQSLSFKFTALVPALLCVGFLAFMLSNSSLLQQMGRIIIGLSLMILSLGMVVSASTTLRESALFSLILQRLGDDVFLTVVLGAMLTWIFHSSVAFILLIASLAGSGAIAVSVAIGLVLGANIGSGLIPIGLSLSAPASVRRVLYGNLAFRLLGASLAIVFINELLPLLPQIESEPARQIANFHSLFNVALALMFLPFTSFAANLLTSFLPETIGKEPGHPEYLDDALLVRPALAISSASREVMNLSSIVETMLREVILAFGKEGAKRREKIKELDVPVDRLHEAIKLYLTRLMRQPLSEEDSRKTFNLIVYTTNLEHIGDIIDKSLLELAAKMQRQHLTFSDEGWNEISTLHARIVDQMRLAITVFMTGDHDMARELVAEKDKIRKAEKQAAESHFGRLRDGTLASIETTALHLDIIRDLKRINAHITSVAYPILEATGAISESRLKMTTQKTDTATAYAKSPA